MHFTERASSVHRGDYQKARQAIVVANLELTALEPRLITAHHLGQIPPATVVELCKARLLVARVDTLIRSALDIHLADSKWLPAYADSHYIPLDDIRKAV